MSFRETTARPQDWDEGSLRYGMKSKGKKMKWKVEDLKAASIAWIVTMILILMNIFTRFSKKVGYLS